MARQVLENGVVLPAEYSDDWYDDMTSNLTKLDDVIGSDSEKLSSSDVGAAALSNNYNDLDNLPTIPTVNDATLTIQKNGVDVQSFTANASSNVTANITVPTKTSDLTNDSNFVDTSNPAVASGITSAKVTDYDSHVADTDIHVTTADKNKWNNQTYVFRYSSTALVASSTNSNTLLDNTDNLKVGDKVIDSDGVLFSITAIDSVNSTFTVGSALVDLALDANVVHTSGNETVGGNKTFTGVNEILRPSGDHKLKITDTRVTPLNPTESITSNITWQDSTGRLLGTVANVYDSSGNSIMQLYVRSFNANDESESHRLRLISNKGGNSYADVDVNFLPSTDNRISLGSSTLRWNGVYATNYYYGSNNVEFSTKFVTTDTAQTISESKTFANTIKSQKEIELSGNRLAYILPEFSASYSGLSLCTYGSSGAVKIGSWKVDDNDNTKHVLDTSLGYLNVTTGAVNSVNSVYLTPRNTTDSKLGDSTNKWKEINGLTPSSLSMPTDNASNIIDISSYMTVLDGSQANTYQAPDNGYIGITMSNCTGIQVYITGFWGNQIVRPTAGVLRFFMPICKNMTANILVFGGTVDNARFIPCQGNV